MNLYFDIGGTNFRYYIFSFNNKKLIKTASYKRTNNILEQLYNFIKNLYLFYKFDVIKVAIPGYLINNHIYGVNNAEIEDETPLITNFNKISIQYFNDGDAFIIGELISNKIKKKNNNILGIIFGTGVGSGLIINGKLVINSEIFLFLEDFMKNNYLTNENIDHVTTFLSKEFLKFIYLLNLNYIVINGYVNNFENFKNLILKKIELKSNYNTKIIFSKEKIPNVLGLINADNFI